ncbi:MAG TPA: DUF2695 domain-containing protein [Candidatus Dormibacteraeota bacterium]|jgi:hypothetical protein|nr:DUF2695 domain-containing protein [Candidatus Dormibacteraeota bacterium]
MSNDPRKEELKKAWKEQERQKLIASIPMPQQDLRNLLDHLDRENPQPCDHTLRETIEFLKKRGLDVEHIVPWLREHGGYCDCEVIFNVDDKFGEIVGRSR